MRARSGSAGAWIVACAVLLAACSGPDSQTLETPRASSAPVPDGWGSESPTPAATGAGSPAPEASAAPDPSDCIDQLPLDVRIGQTMLVTTTDIPRVQRWLDDGLIAGLLSNGVLTPELAGALERATYGTQYGALLAADEEGGTVQRYREVVGGIPSAREQAATMTPQEVRSLYARHGAALSDWGVDMVMAPVVDVGYGPGIGSRAYSQDPAVVTRYAAAAAKGYTDAGLIPVLKHFPGHGGSAADTHDSVAIGPPLDRLRAVDFLPFTGVPAQADVGIMVGHTTIPGYSEAPASQSKKVITGLLVDDLGFEGLIVSDALGMAAAGAPDQGTALVGFLTAGGDLGIVGPGGSVEGRRAVRAALKDGTLSEERLNDAAAAVLEIKGVNTCDVSGAPAPDVDDRDVPEDSAVTNPAEES